MDRNLSITAERGREKATTAVRERRRGMKGTRN
jgi:hypothetical protein